MTGYPRGQGSETSRMNLGVSQGSQAVPELRSWLSQQDTKKRLKP